MKASLLSCLRILGNRWTSLQNFPLDLYSSHPFAKWSLGNPNLLDTPRFPVTLSLSRSVLNYDRHTGEDSEVCRAVAGVDFDRV